MKTNNTMKTSLITFLTLVFISAAAANAQPVVEEINVDQENLYGLNVVEVSLEAEDYGEADLIEAHVRMDDGEWRTKSCENPLSCDEVTFKFYPDEGTHTIDAKVFDSSPQFSQIKSKSFTVSTDGETQKDFDLKNVGSTKYRFSKGDNGQLQADVENRKQYNAEVKVNWYAVDGDSETRIATRQKWVDGKSTDTLAETVTWYDLRSVLEKDKSYDLKAKLFYSGKTVKEVEASGDLYIKSESEQTEVRIERTSASHKGDGRVRFFLKLNQDVNGYSCRVSKNDQITTYDSPVMEKMSGSDRKFEANSEFSDGSYTRYLGCLDEDNKQVSSAEKVTFTVDTTQEDTEPEAFFTVSDSSPRVGESVRFDASESAGDIKEYAWTFPDGSKKYGKNVYKSFSSRGEKKVRLKVTDYDGDADSFTRTINVKSKTRTTEDLDAEISVSNSNPFVGESVRFDGSNSEGNIKEYRWTFGDGTIRYGLTTFKIFSSKGTKNAQLKVTDTSGNTDTDSVSVNVRERQKCKVYVGDLSFSDSDTSDNNAEAEVRVSNRGDPQDVKVQFFVEDEKVSESDTEIGTGGERRFSTDFTAERGTDARAEIRTSGDPCGSRFYERSATFQNDITGDGEPVARLDIDPRNADTGQEIDFDARDSSDPDGEIEEYEFDIDGDGDYEITSEEGEVERTFFEELERTAKVRVTDNEGNTDTVSGDYSVRARSRVSFSDIEIPQNACSGENFEVTFTARNIGDDERILIVEGEGFGDRNSYSTHLEEDEQEEVTITFTTGEPGTEDFTIDTVGGNSDIIHNSIEVLDCADTGADVSGISMKVVPDRVRAGEAVKISGYVDNARGREDVEIEMNSRRMKTVETEPDGYYSTYIYPERTGDFELRAKTDSHRATRDLTVLPTVSVGNIEVPETVFQGDGIEVCAEVNSQNIPAVVLKVNGEIVESKSERGNVCFETTVKKQGDVTYEVVGLARGQSSSSSREVRVHEAKPEASSFPGQVASVESGRGIVRATIYNNNDRRTEYFVNINGLPSTWTSTTEKKVILQPGEEREVFFYLTPREEGDYDPLVTITSDTEVVYTERVDVEVGGTSKPRNLSLFERLRNAFL